MKKNVISVIALILCMFSFHMQAQRDMKAFQHLAVGLNVGTTGIGLDFAVPLNPHFALRAGFSALPFTYSTDFDVETPASEYQGNAYPDEVTVKLDAKLRLMNGKVLIDYFPFRKSGFHLSAGAYFGSNKLLKIEGKSDEPIVFDDFVISPDEYGIISAGIKTNAVKPYVGLGFGRSVPRKRIGFKFEIGAIFHGTPKIYSSSSELMDSLNESGETSGITDILQKVTVYPVISFQLNGRIF